MSYMEFNRLINEQVVIQDSQEAECSWFESEMSHGILQKIPSPDQCPLKILLEMMEITPVMMPGTDYRDGDLVEVIEEVVEGSKRKKFLALGTVLRVIQTDQEGEIQRIEVKFSFQPNEHRSTVFH